MFKIESGAPNKMWSTSQAQQSDEQTRVVNMSNLHLLINGFCRTSTTSSVAPDIISFIYVFGKQLWMHSDGKCFELFDCVYHSMCLPEKIVRTYLHQIIDEVQRNPHVAIIEPSDLLLDQMFTLFILNRLNRTNVSTYIAPELVTDEISDKYLKNDACAYKSAIFSIGVIIFILLLGNIPFEIALRDDKWYRMIIKGQWKKYWKTFKAFSISKESKNMLELMLCSWDKRMNIHQLQQCEFYQGEIYTRSEDIIVRLKYQYNLKEELRRKQLKNEYAKILKVAENLNINRIFDVDEDCKMFPDGEIEGMFDVYCSDVEHDKIYYCLAQIIEERYRGSVHFNKDKQCMLCRVKTRRDVVRFEIKVYESRQWKIAYREEEVLLHDEEYKPLYIVRVQRVDGDCYEFLKIKNLGLLVCSDIMSGLSQLQRRGFRNLYSTMAQKKKEDENIYIAEIPRDYHNDSLKYYWF